MLFRLRQVSGHRAGDDGFTCMHVCASIFCLRPLPHSWSD
jgi:hypothetical protein